MSIPVRPFLICCLRSRLDPGALAEAHALAGEGGLDWEEITRTASDERIDSLLYTAIQGRALVPSPVEASWREAYETNAVRNMVLLHELAGVLGRLGKAAVPVILLKGAALGEAVYGNIAVRPMFDLDLLVHREDVRAVLGVLSELGYASLHVETQAGATLDFENEVAFTKQGLVDTMVEVHWSLLNSPHYQHALPMAWFWETAVPVDVDGVASVYRGALALGPEALLLHLCAHLALHHRGERLLWQQDVAEVMHVFRDQLDWEQVLARAQAWDLVLPVQQVVGRVARDWQAPIPDGILQRLSALQPSPAEARVFAWLTAPRRPVAQRFWADLASMPGWRERLRYAWGSLFPSAAYMRQRFGISSALLLPLAYPYRWLVGIVGALLALTRRGETGRRRAP